MNRALTAGPVLQWASLPTSAAGRRWLLENLEREALLQFHPGERLRALREAKGLGQRDIEERTGLLRCYVSRVENDHTTPAIETVEKWARALEIPLYAIFYDGKKPAKPVVLPKSMQLLNSPGDRTVHEKAGAVAFSNAGTRSAIASTNCAEVGLSQETGSQLISSRGRAGLGLSSAA